MKFYVLNKDRQLVPATYEQWSRFLMSPDRVVGMWTFADGTYVSTVFLGIDHRFGGKGRPLFYETMVFGGPMDGVQERTSTWTEAEQTHERMCRRAKVLQ